MLELFVKEMLTSNAPASVTAAVGGRVFPAVIPKRCQYAAVRYAAISFPPGERTSTAAQHTTKEAQFQIDVFGRSYLQATRVASAINEHLDGYQGEFNSAHGNYVIQLVEVTSQRPGYESGLEIHSQTLELTIIYRRV